MCISKRSVGSGSGSGRKWDQPGSGQRALEPIPDSSLSVQRHHHHRHHCHHHRLHCHHHYHHNHHHLCVSVASGFSADDWGQERESLSSFATTRHLLRVIIIIQQNNVCHHEGWLVDFELPRDFLGRGPLSYKTDQNHNNIAILVCYTFDQKSRLICLEYFSPQIRYTSPP